MTKPWMLDELAHLEGAGAGPHRQDATARRGAAPARAGLRLPAVAGRRGVRAVAGGSRWSTSRSRTCWAARRKLSAPRRSGTSASSTQRPTGHRPAPLGRTPIRPSTRRRRRCWRRSSVNARSWTATSGSAGRQPRLLRPQWPRPGPTLGRRGGRAGGRGGRRSHGAGEARRAPGWLGIGCHTGRRYGELLLDLGEQAASGTRRDRPSDTTGHDHLLGVALEAHVARGEAVGAHARVAGQDPDVMARARQLRHDRPAKGSGAGGDQAGATMASSYSMRCHPQGSTLMLRPGLGCGGLGRGRLGADGYWSCRVGSRGCAGPGRRWRPAAPGS
jgi:hypothetical protein